MPLFPTILLAAIPAPIAVAIVSLLFFSGFVSIRYLFPDDQP